MLPPVYNKSSSQVAENHSKNRAKRASSCSGHRHSRDQSRNISSQSETLCYTSELISELLFHRELLSSAKYIVVRYC